MLFWQILALASKVDMKEIKFTKKMMDGEKWIILSKTKPHIEKDPMKLNVEKIKKEFKQGFDIPYIKDRFQHESLDEEEKCQEAIWNFFEPYLKDNEAVFKDEKLLKANGFWKVAKGNMGGLKELVELPDMSYLFKRDGTLDMRYGVNKLKRYLKEML